MRYLVNTKILQVQGVKIYAARFLSNSLYFNHLYISSGTRILLVIFTGLGKILARKYRRNPESSHYTAYSCFCSVSAVFVYFSPDSAVTVIRMLNTKPFP